MSRIVVLLLLIVLGACAGVDAGRQAATDPGDRHNWRLANGKPPSGVEYAAIVAACQDGAVSGARGKPLTACLGDLGLRRAE